MSVTRTRVVNMSSIFCSICDTRAHRIVTSAAVSHVRAHRIDTAAAVSHVRAHRIVTSAAVSHVRAHHKFDTSVDRQ